MPENTLSLSAALSMHKEATVEEVSRKRLLKAAATYAIAIKTPDIELRKSASAALASVISERIMAKGAGIANLARRAATGIGKAVAKTGRKAATGAGKVVAGAGSKFKSKGLVSAGYGLQQMGVKGVAGAKAGRVGKAVGKAVAAGKKELGKSEVLGAAGRTAKRYAPIAGAAGVGGVLGSNMAENYKGKEKKEAGLFAILTKKAAATPTLLQLLQSKAAPAAAAVAAK